MNTSILMQVGRHKGTLDGKEENVLKHENIIMLLYGEKNVWTAYIISDERFPSTLESPYG